MKYDQEIMNKIHDHGYQMLCKFDDVCRKNDIDYYLLYGTLLGAVRHHDFIPWDDDIDVCLTRENFERLLDHKEEFSPYFIHVPSEEDGFFWDYTARVMDDSVLLKKDSVETEFYHHMNC